MKFIGPFLRINSLNEENISNQLFHLSKESIKHIVLQSKCGIPIAPKELNKHIPKIDINTIKGFSPLLCLYKKASAKLSYEKHKPYWNTEKFKKDIPIISNSMMTLCLLELSDYYKQFKDTDKKKYEMFEVYSALSKCQLEFYGAHLRNIEGVFIDKVHTSDLFSEDIKLTDKNNKFKYSEQAFLMSAYYKYSQLFEDELAYEKNSYAKEYKKFSLDILNMFMNFREHIYDISFNEKLKLSLGLNLFYHYSKIEDIKPLLLDFYDLILEEYNHKISDDKKNKVLINSLMLLNSSFIYKNLKFLKSKEFSENLYKELIESYDENLGLYTKSPEEKSVDYDSSELMTYLISLIFYSNIFEIEDDNSVAENIFKNGVINSGLVLSWPDTPSLNDVERYKNFSRNSDDLLEDDYFRMPTLPTPENNELAPIFIKRITYNRKKNEFKQSKSNFDSERNMTIFFMCIFLYNNFI